MVYNFYMEFEELQIIYKEFETYICNAHGYLSELLPQLNKFILEYNISKHCNRKFAEELEKNLLYLEMFYKNVDEVLEYIENVSFLKLKMPEINNVINIDDYIKIPDDYTESIYMDADNLINLCDNDIEI